MAAPLPSGFTLFFSFFKKTLNSQVKEEASYEENIKSVSTFETVEDFWCLWQHMVKPEQLPIGCEIFLFQKGIKPMWEDSENNGGGRFIVRLKKEVSNRLWEDIVLSFIGEQKEKSKNICGLVCTVKEREVVISTWIKPLDNDSRAAIKTWVLSALDLDLATAIEYRDHPQQ